MLKNSKYYQKQFEKYKNDLKKHMGHNQTNFKSHP